MPKNICCGICKLEGHTSRNRMFHPILVAATAVATTPATPAPALLTHDAILSFNSSAGKGRGANDKNNKIRETILAHILTPACDKFMTPTAPHSKEWVHIRNEWQSSLIDLGDRCNIKSYTSINVGHKGGRACRCDYEIMYNTLSPAVLNVEFKFNEMPQFLNLPANKPLHTTSYAEHYYKHYLDKVLDVLEIPLNEKPAYNLWVQYLYNSNYSKHPFYMRMKNAEESFKQKKAPQTELVAQSIHTYLEQIKDTVDCEYLTREFQSQANKHFLIYNYNSKKFHHDMYTNDELIAKKVSHISNKNTLVIESGKPGSYHHLLLRWKNHQGILFPAWQIKLVRQ